MEVNYFAILYWFCHTSTWICHRYTRVPHPKPLSHLPPHIIPLGGSSQCTSPKHPVSCIEPGLAIRFIYDIIHVSMPFSQIIPPSPSPIESKSLFYTSVFLLLYLKRILGNGKLYLLVQILASYIHIWTHKYPDNHVFIRLYISCIFKRWALCFSQYFITNF